VLLRAGDLLVAHPIHRTYRRGGSGSTELHPRDTEGIHAGSLETVESPGGTILDFSHLLTRCIAGKQHVSFAFGFTRNTRHIVAGSVFTVLDRPALLGQLEATAVFEADEHRVILAVDFAGSALVVLAAIVVAELLVRAVVVGFAAGKYAQAVFVALETAAATAASTSTTVVAALLGSAVGNAVILMRDLHIFIGVRHIHDIDGRGHETVFRFNFFRGRRFIRSHVGSCVGRKEVRFYHVSTA